MDCMMLSSRASQRARPGVAGPLTGSTRAGTHNHKFVEESLDRCLWIPDSRLRRLPG
jgi:hypothetical protein